MPTINDNFRGQQEVLLQQVLAVLRANGTRDITGPIHGQVDVNEVNTIFTDLLPVDGENFRIVRTAARMDDADTTEVYRANGQNLLAAYTAAKLLLPNGQPVSSTNPVNLLLVPTIYDLVGNQLSTDTDGINLIGLGPKEQVVITGAQVGNDPDFNMRAVVLQTATTVHYENLTIQNTATSRGLGLDGPDGGAFGCPGSISGTLFRNVLFSSPNDTAWPTVPGSTLDARFENCSSTNGFGSSALAQGVFDGGSYGNDFIRGGSIIGATMKKLVCGDNSFAYGGTIAGSTIEDCMAGDQCFAFFDINGTGIANSTLTRITCGNDCFAHGAALANVKIDSVKCGTFCFAAEGGSIASDCVFSNITAVDMAFGCSDAGAAANVQGSYTNCTTSYGWGSTNSGTASTTGFPTINRGGGFVASSRNGNGGTARGNFNDAAVNLACGGANGGTCTLVTMTGGSGYLSGGFGLTGLGGTITSTCRFTNVVGSWAFGTQQGGTCAALLIDCDGLGSGAACCLCSGGSEPGSTAGTAVTNGTFTGLAIGGAFNYVGLLTGKLIGVTIKRENNTINPMILVASGFQMYRCNYLQPSGVSIEASSAVSGKFDGCHITGTVGVNVTNTAPSPHNY